MLDGTTGVLVAVSGGPDSVALLDILVRISASAEAASDNQSTAQRDGFTTPKPLIPKIHVAHLDHMLRGSESAEDAEFVRALAQLLGLQSTISSVDVRGAASHSRRGIEETAREIRYNYLLAVAKDAGCDRIAVGHTMTDQAETFLMRLVRGAGPRGLAAMRPVVAAHTFGDQDDEKAEGRRQKADLKEKAEGRKQNAAGGTLAAVDSGLPSAFCLLPSVSLIRPLLCITREEVEEYCDERGLKFRTDKTNLSLHYTRNRIRTGVLPALAALNPRIVESISRAAENIAGDQDVLDALACSLLRNSMLASHTWRDAGDQSIVAYSVTALLEQPLEMRRRMIIESIRQMRARAKRRRAQDHCEVTSVHIAAVEELLRQNASGKHVALPCSLEVWREFDALVIRIAETGETPYLSAISSTCANVEAGGFVFTLQRDLPSEVLGSLMAEVRQQLQTTGRDWMAVALDDRALPDELIIRPRVRGERTHIAGHLKTIKLKNLMIDHRIPFSRRATWPIVATPDGAYIWSPGLPPSVEFAAQADTSSLAMLRARAI